MSKPPPKGSFICPYCDQYWELVSLNGFPKEVIKLDKNEIREKRDKEIYLKYRKGVSASELASLYSMSVGNLYLILRKQKKLWKDENDWLD